MPQDGPNNMQFGPYGFHHTVFGVGRGFGLLLLLALVVAGTLLVASLMHRRTQQRSGQASTSVAGGGSPALQMLDERFARGEIDAEDYKVRRDLLSHA